MALEYCNMGNNLAYRNLEKKSCLEYGNQPYKVMNIQRNNTMLPR